MKKSKWTNKFPSTNGWFWVRYEGKHGTVICPAEVSQMHYQSNPVTFVRTARSDHFNSDYVQRDFEEIEFGPEIIFPVD